MLPKKSVDSHKIKLACYYLAGLQLTSPIYLAIVSSIYFQYEDHVSPLLVLVLLFLYGVLMLYILLNHDECPNCGKRFFFKGENGFNLGFSMYTHKCSNCKHKLL